MIFVQVFLTSCVLDCRGCLGIREHLRLLFIDHSGPINYRDVLYSYLVFYPHIIKNQNVRNTQSSGEDLVRTRKYIGMERKEWNKMVRNDWLFFLSMMCLLIFEGAIFRIIYLVL